MGLEHTACLLQANRAWLGEKAAVKRKILCLFSNTGSLFFKSHGREGGSAAQEGERGDGKTETNSWKKRVIEIGTKRVGREDGNSLDIHCWSHHTRPSHF